jgi:hypothetical protein
MLFASKRLASPFSSSVWTVHGIIVIAAIKDRRSVSSEVTNVKPPTTLMTYLKSLFMGLHCFFT